ncbi:hypothetical protein [uncultured Leptotrichia sp.]|uniref:hypothetical protein n=1 Tax=uncultured Leptotrichia sp. TaxID=159271 RepID=UPI0025D20CEB|nr:hypothetical protein [uncultured Leptotrichia sp.]
MKEIPEKYGIKVGDYYKKVSDSSLGYNYYKILKIYDTGIVQCAVVREHSLSIECFYLKSFIIDKYVKSTQEDFKAAALANVLNVIGEL